MPAERRRAATLDRTHHTQLVKADMPGISRTPRRPVIAEDVRDLQRWTAHGFGVLPGRLAPGLPARAAASAQIIERALHGRDHAGRHPRVARGGLQLVVTEQRPRIRSGAASVFGVKHNLALRAARADPVR